MEFRALASPAGAVQSAQGIDVSNFQGNYDWGHAKASVPGLAFGIFRLTQGLGGAGRNSPDPFAAHNHGAIAAQGLVRGAYHFLDPALDGAAQASYFVTQYGKLGLTGTDMLWLDNETGSNPAQVAACGRSFMAELDKLAPHNPRGVYTFISFARDGHNAGLGGYPLWLAFPALAAPAPPPPWHNWTFWQWGQRNGADVDAYNGTAAQLHSWIASFAPKPAGPFRHVADGTQSLAQIARARNTTVEHLIAVTMQAVKPEDMTAALVHLLELNAPLPSGTVWYSTNP